jgi:ligand-binding sensor domain-containing protein
MKMRGARSKKIHGDKHPHTMHVGGIAVSVAVCRESLIGLRVVVALALLHCLSASIRAERLPARYYTADEGLADNRVMRIRRDSQGFLWFCTPGGLSRFDGERFTTVRLEEELVATFNDLLETRSGEYWAATNGRGVCRLSYSTRKRNSETDAPFTIYPVGGSGPTNFVNVLYEDRGGRIWAGTDGGLFALDIANGEQSFAPVCLNIPSHPDRFVQIWAITQDSRGSLWIGTKYGLACLKDGRIIRYPIRPKPDGTDVVRDLLIDGEGRVWIGHQAGLVIVKPLPATTGEENRPLWQTVAQTRTGSKSEELEIELPSAYGQALWLVTGNVWCMRQVSNGKIYKSNEITAHARYRIVRGTGTFDGRSGEGIIGAAGSLLPFEFKGFLLGRVSF